MGETYDFFSMGVNDDGENVSNTIDEDIDNSDLSYVDKNICIKLNNKKILESVKAKKFCMINFQN